MESEALESRLKALEEARIAEMQLAQQKAFMNQFGSKISNNENLGLVMLNELNRRGIDVSAAGEAVDQMIDQMRTECNMLLQAINGIQEQAIQQQDKLDAMSNAVKSAMVKSGEGGEMLPPDMGAGAPPADIPSDADVPPDSGAIPPDMGAGAPPADVPPDAGAIPPDMGAGAPPAEMPPNMQPSDERIKRIQGAFSKLRESRKSSQQNSNHIPSNMQPSDARIKRIQGMFAKYRSLKGATK